jgi:Tol biopolymer transport system component
MTLAPGQRLGPYEIEGPLGAGGMGQVFKARDERLGRSVAIKVLAPDLANDEKLLSRFEREAKVIGQLSHPNICTLYDIGSQNGTTYLVMELVDGETLSDRVARGPMSLRDVIRYGIEIANALDRAHRAGVVHRDLKPANIMITKTGAKLLDFGLARPSRPVLGTLDPDAPTAQHTITAEGTIAGTLPYMPPEQLRGEAVDARADIYALGAVLYEMVTGRRAFTSVNSASLIAEILEHDPPRVADLQPGTPPALERIVTTCLEKDLGARFQCAADVARLLSWASVERAADAAPRAQASQRRRWLFIASILIGFLGIGAAAASYFIARRPSAYGALRFNQLTFDRGEETQPALAPDGKMFAFVKRVGERRHIFLQRIDGRSAIDLTPDSPADDRAPAFSPDGTTIAFRSDREGGGIFLMGATGESVRRLTNRGHNPSWSPDGKSILVAEQETVDPAVVYGLRNIYAVDVATGAMRTLYSGIDSLQPSWSPHGKRVAFWTAQRGDRDIYTIDANGDASSAVAVTSDSPTEWNPVWSRDGRQLYFLSDREGTMNIWVVDIDEDTGRPRSAPRPRRPPATYAALVSVWRQCDGLAYQSASAYGEIVRSDIDSTGRVTGPSTVLAGSMPIRYTAMSPDGKWIAFAIRGTSEDVYLMKADGTGIRQLTSDAARDRGVSWWPDSSRIVFYSNRSGEYDAYSIRTDGSGLTRLTAIAGGVNFPRVSPDQRSLAYISDAGGGAAIADISGPLPVKHAALLPAPLGNRFIPLAWSTDGKFLVGGRYGGSGIDLYDLTTKTYTTISTDGRRAGFLDDGTLVVQDADDRLAVFDARTRSLRPIGNQHTEDFRVIHGAIGGRSVIVYRARAESDIWHQTSAPAPR